MIYHFILWLCLSFSLCLTAQNYPLSNDPIDVVIPCIEKDLLTLDRCIAGIRENGYPIRRIIVVSPARLTEQAEWFDEALFPFTKKDVAFYLSKKNRYRIKRILEGHSGYVGWYFQQLLKLYSPLVIPNLSPNVLVLDADTIFLNPVRFLDERGGGLYATGSENHLPYFRHLSRCLPGLQKVFANCSGITHHMLFQLPIIQDLFSSIETLHQKPLWQVFCLSADNFMGSYASEYELYFNFAFARTDQVHIRFLKWANVTSIENLDSMREQGYHYASAHTWLRENK